MTATEELRRLLDERGVEWRRTPHYSSESFDNETVFNNGVIDWLAYDHINGRVGLRALKYEVTPEQAVEATLGSEESAILAGIVVKLEDAIERLEAENAKLRDELDFCLKHAPNCDGCEAMLDCDECLRADSSQKERKRLDYENVKLRELVRDMYGYAVNREMELCNACVEADGDYAGCNACDEYDGACGIAKKRFEELYADHMRELGVEV